MIYLFGTFLVATEMFSEKLPIVQWWRRCLRIKLFRAYLEQRWLLPVCWWKVCSENFTTLYHRTYGAEYGRANLKSSDIYFSKYRIRVLRLFAVETIFWWQKEKTSGLNVSTSILNATTRGLNVFSTYRQVFSTYRQVFSTYRQEVSSTQKPRFRNSMQGM